MLSLPIALAGLLAVSQAPADPTDRREIFLKVALTQRIRETTGNPLHGQALDYLWERSAFTVEMVAAKRFHPDALDMGKWHPDGMATFYRQFGARFPTLVRDLAYYTEWHQGFLIEIANGGARGGPSLGKPVAENGEPLKP